MKLKVLRMYDDVKLPVYATDGSGCFDIFGHDIEKVESNKMVWNTGIKVDIPKGHVMLIYSRSGHGFKNDIRLANCVGVIDSDYRGELKVKLTCDADNYPVTGPVHGNAIAQAMVIPYEQVEFEEVSELSNTQRGEGGFGSTNKGNI